jgi:hypothetical protein
VRREAARQIEIMTHLNNVVKRHRGKPVFNDSDLQVTSYATALKVLTAYTYIGGENVVSFTPYIRRSDRDGRNRPAGDENCSAC